MRRVELHTAQRVKPGHEHDYCVRDGLKGMTVTSLGGFSRHAGKARRLSRHIGEVDIDNNHYPETDALEKGMAAVYVQTSEFWNGVLEVERFDFFEKGHAVRTIKYEYSECGKVSRTEYTYKKQ